MKKRKEDFTYSLPLDTIVGGRYLIQEVCRVQGDQIIYLAADLVEKKQVELTEYFPQDLVTRDGAGGEENVTVLPGGQEQLLQQIRQFEKEHDNTVRDHHTVYAVSEIRNENKGKMPVWASVLCLAVIVVGFGMLVSLFLSAKGQNEGSKTVAEDMSDTEIVDMLLKEMCQDEEVDLQESLPEETTTYSEYCQVYHPGYTAVAYDSEEQVLYYNNILLVHLLDKLSEQEKQQLAELAGGEIVGYISGAMELLQLKVPTQNAASLEQCAQKLMENEHVLYASTDGPIGIENNDEDNNPWCGSNENPESDKGNVSNPGGNDWWAEAIDAYGGWEYTKYAEPIKVAVIDSGFSEIHEDMDIHMMNENQADNHGTHVAGLIAAKNNSVGIRGVADQAELVGINWNQRDTNLLSQCGFLALLSEAVRQGCKVVNMSFGKYGMSRLGYDFSEDNAINNVKRAVSGEYELYLENLKTSCKISARYCMTAMINLHVQGYDDYLLVQAAGNGVNNGEGPGLEAIINGFFCSLTGGFYTMFLPDYPEKVQKIIKNAGGYPYFSGRILGVGAVKNEKNDQGYYKMRESSNYGSQVDICAPGEDIYSTLAVEKKGKKTVERNNLYGTLSGTSMAAPIVSGAAALVWSVNPDLEAFEVRNILRETAKTKAIDEDSPESLNRYPMLNVKAAVEKAYEMRKKESDVISDTSETPETSKIPEIKEIPTKVSEKTSEKKLPKDLFEQYLQSTLIPQYGLMSTDAWQLSTSLNTWEKGDDSPMDGILSALIRDLDGDGQDEMLVVRFVPGDESRMYLEIYEANGQNVGFQDEVAFDTSDYCKYRWDARLTVFAKEYQGETSLYLYAYDDSGNDFTNETIQQLKYRDNSLKISKYWQFQTGWDRAIWLESGTVKDAECNRRQLISWQEEGWYDESHIKEVLTQEKTLGSDDNVDTSTAEYQEELNTLLTKTYADLQSETGLTFKRCADTDMVNGMIAHTLVWSGRDLFYNHGEDDSTYVAALDNQYRDDVNTLVPFDYTEIVRK